MYTISLVIINYINKIIDYDTMNKYAEEEKEEEEILFSKSN